MRFRIRFLIIFIADNVLSAVAVATSNNRDNFKNKYTNGYTTCFLISTSFIERSLIPLILKQLLEVAREVAIFPLLLLLSSLIKTTTRSLEQKSQQTTSPPWCENTQKIWHINPITTNAFVYDQCICLIINLKGKSEYVYWICGCVHYYICDF
jgi:hypothetical protein